MRQNLKKVHLRVDVNSFPRTIEDVQVLGYAFAPILPRVGFGSFFRAFCAGQELVHPKPIRNGIGQTTGVNRVGHVRRFSAPYKENRDISTHGSRQVAVRKLMTLKRESLPSNRIFVHGTGWVVDPSETPTSWSTGNSYKLPSKSGLPKTWCSHLHRDDVHQPPAKEIVNALFL